MSSLGSLFNNVRIHILDTTTENDKCHYSKCLSGNAVNKFEEAIVSYRPTVEYGRATEGDDL